MQNINHINLRPERAKRENRCNFLTMIEEEPLLTRLYKIMRSPVGQTATDSRPQGHSEAEPGLEMESYADLAFLKHVAVAPFPVRLRREFTETIRVIRHDPASFISQIAKRKSASPDHKRRRNTGIMVAILVYAVVLSAIYVSYVLIHRRNANSRDKQQLKITHLQLPPMPVTKSPSVLKQPVTKNPLAAPQAEEQQKTEQIKSAPQPREPDQTQTKPEPQTRTASVASELPAPAEAFASAGAAASGTGNVSGTGNGTGARQEVASSARVNYNDVFSVSSVTARPQIVGRPTPGYTEEARRAQVEGAVRLSVVLGADGTVSEIRVVHGLGYGLDERAIEAARQLRFVPAQKDGHKVSVRVFLEFKFTLL